ncbi:MAG: hypothetical protein JO100_17190 [Pseudonocardia sp.]|nr:hypothetical protein [Pseudonocardia sp.]
MIVLSVLVIVALIAGLAFYLYWVGSLLGGIATNLEASEQSIQRINADAALIGPGIEHINHTGGTVAGALPLLYGFAERIVTKASPTPQRSVIATPASGRRRSRLHKAVGFTPED